MFDSFKKFPNLIVAVSTKADGPMGLSYQVQDNTEVKSRREKFLEKHGIALGQLVTGRLIHGNTVAVVNLSDAGSVIPDSDGLATGDKNVFLSITVADCLPVFFFDPVKEAVALAHAGWRGIIKEIPMKVIDVMQESFGSKPSNLIVGVGPHICAEHYVVKSDVSTQFSQYDSVVSERDGKEFLDLGQAIKIQLLSRGVKEENIELSKECNFELSDVYYSARRDKPEKLQTMMAVIGLRKK